MHLSVLLRHGLAHLSMRRLGIACHAREERWHLASDWNLNIYTRQNPLRITYVLFMIHDDCQVIHLKVDSWFILFFLSCVSRPGRKYTVKICLPRSASPLSFFTIRFRSPTRLMLRIIQLNIRQIAFGFRRFVHCITGTQESNGSQHFFFTNRKDWMSVRSLVVPFVFNIRKGEEPVE